MQTKPFTVRSFQEQKKAQQPITMVTAYDYTMAKIVDRAGVDAVLVGDSVGMVFQGEKTTIPVTLEQMIYHSRCVAQGLHRATLIVDMPFLTTSIAAEETVRNAGRLIQEGRAQAVKIEGGVAKADTIQRVVAAQIPVMGHIGLTPQSVHALGGFRVQGRDESTARRILADAAALETAGVFAIVLEAIPAPLARLVTEQCAVPTIGIGAGLDCDGQVLVSHDMLGMFDDFTPAFVKRYAEVGSTIQQAVENYVADVRNRTFPELHHSFTIDDAVIEALY